MNNTDLAPKTKPKFNRLRKKPSGITLFVIFCFVIVALFDVSIVSHTTSNNNTSKNVVSSKQSNQTDTAKKIINKTKSSSSSSANTVAVVAPVVVPSPKSSVYQLTLTNPKASANVAPNYNSSNWAGYMATRGNFTGITASWGVPEALGSYQSTSGDGTWIGIGGITSSDLIQIGTQNTVSADGQVSTTGFYEILPAGPQTISTLDILPGTPVTASIDETQPGLWKATLTNQSNEQAFTIYLLYNSSGSSGEWVEEDPTISPGQFEALDNFGTVSFTSASATINGSSINLSGSGAQQIKMVNGSKAIIGQPSSIKNDTNFDVNWQ